MNQMKSYQFNQEPINEHEPELFQPYPISGGGTVSGDELVDDVDVVDDVHDERLSFEKDNTGLLCAVGRITGVSGQLILVVRFQGRETVRGHGFLALGCEGDGFG